MFRKSGKEFGLAVCSILQTLDMNPPNSIITYISSESQLRIGIQIHIVTWRLNAGSVAVREPSQRRPLLENGYLKYLSATTDKLVETRALLFSITCYMCEMYT
jgi:hypothetical protein